jgi:beta-N-acetylhexosaminidase
MTVESEKGSPGAQASRIAALFALLLVSLAPAAAADLPSEPAAPGLSAVPLRAMLGQMILIGFPGTKPAEEWPARVIKMIRDSEIGGVILFPGNIVDPAQLKALDAALTRAGGGTPPFIAVDQEGGAIQRLTVAKGFAGLPSARKVASGDEAAAYRLYRDAARELAGVGINLNFGPVVDLEIDLTSPAIGKLERSFGRDPVRVASFARQFIDAHHDAGVLVAAKHFPGHGSAALDTHDDVVDIGKTWVEAELAPFRDLASDQVADMIMVGHLTHPRFSDGDEPASLSRRAMQDVLRGELGFRGLVITDDLEMAAIQSRYGVEAAAVLAVAAGADLLIFANLKQPDPTIVDRVLAALSLAVDRGRIPRATIEQAYRRILAAKAKIASRAPPR